MEHPTKLEAAKCRTLAAHMRTDAARATLPGFADRLLQGADALEQHAFELVGWEPLFF